MRAIGLAMIAIQVGLTVAGKAETPAESDRSITDVLPLFVKNRCEDIRNPADQMFCGDPELNAVGVKLNAAIAERLNRIPNHNCPAIHRAETVSVHGLLRPVVRFSGWARECSDPLTPANQDRPDE
jgi:hypothetical protein